MKEAKHSSMPMVEEPLKNAVGVKLKKLLWPAPPVPTMTWVIACVSSTWKAWMWPLNRMVRAPLLRTASAMVRTPPSAAIESARHGSRLPVLSSVQVK